MGLFCGVCLQSDQILLGCSFLCSSISSKQDTVAVHLRIGGWVGVYIEYLAEAQVIECRGEDTM